mgnify:CR=1 FL=1
MTFFLDKNIFLEILFLKCSKNEYSFKKRKEQTMNRKHLVAIGVVIAVLLLLYWLFVAEDMNAWLNVN